MVRIVFFLKCIEPWQLPFSVPSHLPFIAVPIVDIDFDVGGASAARGNEDAACVTADSGSGGGGGAVCEADVEKAAFGNALVRCSSVGTCGVLLTYKRATALRYGYAVASSGTNSMTRDAYMSIARNDLRKLGYSA